MFFPGLFILAAQKSEAFKKLQRAFDELNQTRPAFQAAITESRTKLEEIKSKPIVVARNNLDIAKHLVDSDTSDDDSEADLMPENDEVDNADDENVHETNEFVDDEAESVGDDYETGDSMDDEEREEMRLNEIHDDGESVGSETSDDDINEENDEDDKGSLDSFIVDDTEEFDDSNSDSSESINVASKNIKKRSKKRFSRIMVAETESEDDDEKVTDVVSNDQRMDVDDNVEMTECDDILKHEAKQIDEAIGFEAEEAKKNEDIEKAQEAIEVEEAKMAAEAKMAEKAQEARKAKKAEDAKKTQAVEQAAERADQNNDEIAIPTQKTDEVIVMEPDSTDAENATLSPTPNLVGSRRVRYSLPGIRPLGMPVQRSNSRKSHGDSSENSRPVTAADVVYVASHIKSEPIETAPTEGEPIKTEPVEVEPIDVENQENGTMDTTKDASAASVKNVSITSNEENNNDKQGGFLFVNLVRLQKK